MELMKGSLNTFLNAFTYPDRTCYPVASCNLQVRHDKALYSGEEGQVLLDVSTSSTTMKYIFTICNGGCCQMHV